MGNPVCCGSKVKVKPVSTQTSVSTDINQLKILATNSTKICQDKLILKVFENLLISLKNLHF